jgi:hypothetical protein
MRTKSILLGAAVLAAGVASSMAQNVYSVNVVGYINQAYTGDQVHNGGLGIYTLIANPLDASANGGNAWSNIFQSANMPDGTTVVQWDPIHLRFVSDEVAFGGWNNGGTNVSAPGNAVFVLSTGNWTNTFTGTVMQGSLSNVFGNHGQNSFVGSQIPISGTADSLGLTAGLPDGTVVSPWSVANQTYANGSYTWAFGSWSDPHGGSTPPPVAVGQGFLINTPPGQPGYWATNFVVQ